MGYAEKRGDYWRGRYKISPGKYGTVADDTGRVLRFRTKREAESAANDEEADVRAGRWVDRSLGQVTFGDYVNRWYAAQDLARSTMQTYRYCIEGHLLPAFQDMPVAEITSFDVDAWEKRERAVPYAASSVRGWRKILHLIMSDAVADGLRGANPATKRRGRGRHTGRSAHRAAEKVITDALGLLLIAERMALLSGRDDEFIATLLMGFTGIRWGELVGMEVDYVRPDGIRVEWQIYELDSGEFHRCPPKYDSRRTIDCPEWLNALLAAQVAERRTAQPCACHSRRYLFSGHRPANGAASRPGPRLVDVARRAGVSTGTVSSVLNRPSVVAEKTRSAVLAATEALGFIVGNPTAEVAPHWRRSGFASWLFQPATTGRYPKQNRALVPVLADPWPGVPARGRGAAARADSCWLPIAEGLTPHGLRHSHRTLMEELITPPKLMDERMGHEDGSVQARYTHVTPEMRRRLMAGLTEAWRCAVTARREMATGSPVAALDAILRRPN